MPNLEESQSMNKSQIMKKSKIMVALDYPSVDEALQLIEKLAGYKPFLKIGMQLFYLSGPQLIYQLKEKGFSIFLDLKLHDIPNTVKGASQSLSSLGVDIFNVHCAGGQRMMEAALEGVEKGLSSYHTHAPRVIGVTQLTSTSQQMMNQEIGIPGELSNSVSHYAKQAKQSGLNGVVCSALEVPMIKGSLGENFITVTPGIRLNQSNVGDQVRITTPLEAARLGTDYMVIGRAITEAEDPAAMYEKISNDLLNEDSKHRIERG
jgi:orotidine-5'-phosphate decarboxylase